MFNLNKLNIKSPFLKKILIVFLGILGLFLILVIGTAANELWKGYKWQKAVDKWQESLEKPYKEDVYGGKTPEETWKMFLDALKAGDIELASRYYDVEHQNKAKEWLKELRQDDKLTQWIQELETLEKDEESALGNKIYYSYKYYDEETQQNLWSNVIFYLNPYTKIWKIVW